MDPVWVTAISAAVIGILGTPPFVKYVNHRSKAPTIASVATLLQQEVDRLQKQRDKDREDHERSNRAIRARSAQELADVEAKWRRQHEEDQVQITRLKEEVDDLYRKLVRRE